jgi:murein DD-endopeptidase MepM/ murein hydrolase activator NlpD
MKIGDKVKKGDIIGYIHSYYDSGKDYPHLHWGVWLGSSLPTGLLGYDKSFRMFTDPNAYLDYASPGWTKPTQKYNTNRYRQFAFPLTPTKFHLGDDVYTELNDPVYACLDGEVVNIQYLNGFGGWNPSKKGHVITIKHKNRWGQYFYILYGHCKPKE